MKTSLGIFSLFLGLSIATISFAKPLYTHYPTFPNLEDPSWFYFESRPGQTQTEYLSVTNNSDKELTLEIHAVDTITNSNNETAFLSGRNPQKFFGKWLTPHQTLLQLRPHQYYELPITLTIPKDIPLGNYAGGIEIQKADQKGTLRIRNMIRVHFKVTNNPTPPTKQNPPPPLETYLNRTTTLIAFTLIMTFFAIKFFIRQPTKASQKRNKR